MRASPDGHPPGTAVTRRASLAFGAGGLAWAAGGSAAAAPLPNTIRLVQGGNIGTSYDRYGRAFVAAVAELRPAMRFVVEPMPRANGRLAARLLMNASPDGATIGSFQTSLVYAELLGDEGVAFETARLGWIGSFNVEPRVLVVSAKLGLTSFAELRERTIPVPVGADSVTSVSAREPLLLNALLGTRLRPVTGYSGAARSMAFASGEIGAGTAAIDAVQPLIASGDVRVVLRLDRHAVPPPLDTVPQLHDLAAAHHSDPVFAFLDAHSRLGRWLCMPPATSPEILAAWRALFLEVVTSATYRRIVNDAGLAAHGSTIVSGAEIEAALSDMFRARTTMASALKAALACGHRIAETGERSC